MNTELSTLSPLESGKDVFGGGEGKSLLSPYKVTKRCNKKPNTQPQLRCRILQRRGERKVYPFVCILDTLLYWLHCFHLVCQLEASIFLVDYQTLYLACEYSYARQPLRVGVMIDRAAGETSSSTSSQVH